MATVDALLSYLIFVKWQHHFEANSSRLWTSILQRPISHVMMQYLLPEQMLTYLMVLYNENHLLELYIAIYANDCAVPEGIKVISTPIEIRLANGKLAWTFIVYSRLLIVAVNDLRDFLFR